jgi:hypothetical protein
MPRKYRRYDPGGCYGVREPMPPAGRTARRSADAWHTRITYRLEIFPTSRMMPSNALSPRFDIRSTDACIRDTVMMNERNENAMLAAPCDTRTLSTRPSAGYAANTHYATQESYADDAIMVSTHDAKTRTERCCFRTRTEMEHEISTAADPAMLRNHAHGDERGAAACNATAIEMPAEWDTAPEHAEICCRCDNGVREPRITPEGDALPVPSLLTAPRDRMNADANGPCGARL